VADPATPSPRGDDRWRVWRDQRSGSLDVTPRTSGPTGEVAVRVVDSSDTDAPDSYGLTRDPVADAVEFIMSASADALPASSAELALVLEQLTLPL